jgi:REP-associated tyrosine transposase
MARTARLLMKDEPAVYHVISRTALDGFPFGDAEKDVFVRLLRKKNRLYFTEIMDFCCMGNHFHLLVRMLPEKDYSDSDIVQRYMAYHDVEEKAFPVERTPYFREKWASLSEFIRDIKLYFSRYYNKRHNRRGYFWGDRFKSVIVENGETLINCLAYIDLNPVRAGIVERPEDYRWSSIGYHVQSGNKDGFLSLYFGLEEFRISDSAERFRQYRAYVYKVGALDTGKGAQINENILEKEEETDFNLTQIRRFRYRTRYFSDSGIIGTKEFVATLYQQFKNLFQSKREKIPKPIKGLAGVYSLKQLSEVL